MNYVTIHPIVLPALRDSPSIPLRASHRCSQLGPCFPAASRRMQRMGYDLCEISRGSRTYRSRFRRIPLNLVAKRTLIDKFLVSGAMVHFTFLLLLAEVPEICQASSVCSFLSTVFWAHKIIFIFLADKKPYNPADESCYGPSNNSCTHNLKVMAKGF